MCERCLEHGVVRPAQHVHHIVPIRQDARLRLVWANLMSVCIACHDEIERDGNGGEL